MPRQILHRCRQWKTCAEPHTITDGKHFCAVGSTARLTPTPVPQPSAHVNISAATSGIINAMQGVGQAASNAMNAIHNLTNNLSNSPYTDSQIEEWRNDVLVGRDFDGDVLSVEQQPDVEITDWDSTVLTRRSQSPSVKVTPGVQPCGITLDVNNNLIEVFYEPKLNWYIFKSGNDSNHIMVTPEKWDEMTDRRLDGATKVDAFVGTYRGHRVYFNALHDLYLAPTYQGGYQWTPKDWKELTEEAAKSDEMFPFRPSIHANANTLVTLHTTPNPPINAREGDFWQDYISGLRYTRLNGTWERV